MRCVHNQALDSWFLIQNISPSLASWSAFYVIATWNSDQKIVQTNIKISGWGAYTHIYTDFLDCMEDDIFEEEKNRS